MKITATAALAAIVMTGAAAEAQYYGDPCREVRNQRSATGAIIGGVIGAVIGAEIDDNNGGYYHRGRRGRRHYHRDSNADGALVGGLIGAAIGSGVGGSSVNCHSSSYAYGGYNTYGSYGSHGSYGSYGAHSGVYYQNGYFRGPFDQPAQPAQPTYQRYEPAAQPGPDVRWYVDEGGYPQNYAPTPGQGGDQLLGAPSASTGQAGECRTVTRETNLPDGSAIRESVRACRNAQGNWVIEN